MTEITAKKKDSEKSVTVNYDLPEDHAGLVAKFGEEAVYGAAVDSFTISIQSLIRRHFDKSQEEIQAAVDGWVPGVRGPAVKKSPLEKAKAALSAMTPEQRAALLAELSAGIS